VYKVWWEVSALNAFKLNSACLSGYTTNRLTKLFEDCKAGELRFKIGDKVQVSTKHPISPLIFALSRPARL
jgi:hypothetical protein